ncbi:MAG: hydantoinase/oxoprolinase family protein, partial [Actinomycetota bacterium]|nr:hydantoinase/oxoprolinase family protein [Actinomycetota bacterium]
SADVALVRSGSVAQTTETVVAGVPIRLPSVDVHSVSAGGGSIAWVDDGGALRVGPRSAGADPGPAAYGRGGEEPTVTDAGVVLGLLADGATLGGEVVLRRALAEEAVEKLAAASGLDLEQAAVGVLRVANSEMARALRLMSVERGVDPRGLALVAFGGAGPMHACALAEELGVESVLVPRASGVLSAVGLALTSLRRDRLAPFRTPLSALVRDELERRFRSLEEAAGKGLANPRLVRHADLRYRGQAFELTVEAAEPGELAERFHRAHDERYGYRMEDEEVELVSLRVVASVEREPTVSPEPPPRGDALRGTRRARVGDERREVEVLERAAMGRGSSVEGPAIVELTDATCVLHPGWQGVVDETGTLVLERR